MPTRWFGIRLAGNLRSLMKPPQWALLLSLFGFTLPLFIAKFDKIGDRALAHSTAIVMALWAVAMLLVGVVIEIRIFSELTAFMMPCIALILWSEWIRPAAQYRTLACSRIRPQPNDLCKRTDVGSRTVPVSRILQPSVL